MVAILSIFEIFVIGPSGGFLVDDTIIYHVYGDSHYSITTFNSNKINGQYTRSMIQFTTDGGAGADDGIKFQIKYFGSQYNNNIKFLFYSRVIKGSQSTSFDHAIFNVSDVQDNHTILYFKNLNLNGNLINGLSDPVDNNDATNKIYVDAEIARLPKPDTDVLKLDGSKAMTGNLDTDGHNILSVKNLTDHKVDDAYSDIVKDLKSVVNKEYLNQNFLKIKGNDYDLNQRVIKNSAPHDDGSYDNNTLVSKAFVDAEIAKLPKPDIDVLKLDGSKAMTGNLDMGGKAIKNIKPFVEDDSSQAASDAQKNDVINFGYFHTERGEIKRLINEVGYDALNRKNPDPIEDDIDMAQHSIINLKDPTTQSHGANKKYVNGVILNSNFSIINSFNEKIKQLEEKSIHAVNKENVFKKVMDDDEFKEDDDDIHKVGVQNKDLRLANASCRNVLFGKKKRKKNRQISLLDNCYYSSITQL